MNFDREGGKERGQGVIALSSNLSIYIQYHKHEKFNTNDSSRKYPLDMKPRFSNQTGWESIKRYRWKQIRLFARETSYTSIARPS